MHCCLDLIIDFKKTHFKLWHVYKDNAVFIYFTQLYDYLAVAFKNFFPSRNTVLFL